MGRMTKTTKTTTKNTRGWPLMKRKCVTCPFGPNGDPLIRRGVESRLFKGSQQCHHPLLSGKTETHLCRGARDEQLTILYRVGFIEAETDEAFAKRSRELGVV
jgi:hypothetical protein